MERRVLRKSLEEPGQATRTTPRVTAGQAVAAALRQALSAVETRTGRSITRTALAGCLGVSASSVYAYLNGTTLIPAEVLHRFLVELEVEEEQARRLRGLREQLARPTTPAIITSAMPLDTGHFTGRVRHLEELDRLRGLGKAATTVVVCSVSGTGGIGKTALAVHWAHLRRGRFPDGVLYLDLRGFRHDTPIEPYDALAALLLRLGVPGADLPTSLDERILRYQHLLSGRRALLLLDNAFTADQVRPLLPPGDSGCFVVLTSRDRLDGLAVTHGARPLAVDVLDELESRALLASKLGEQRLAADPAVVAEILLACGGLPLALSVVASRAQANPEVPLAEFATDLGEATTRLSVLSDKDPAASLPAVLAWSLTALTPEQAGLFGLLGIAPGPDISAEATASLAGLPAGRTRALLQELEQSSLLRRDTTGRYRMHDLVRLVARDHSRQEQRPGQREAALSRLVDFYLHTARTANWLIDPHHTPCELAAPTPGCTPAVPADRDASWAWFDAEQLCLQAAQEHALAAGWHHKAFAFGLTQQSVHRLRRPGHDEPTWQNCLAAATALGDPGRLALAHGSLARTLTYRSRYPEARAHLEQAVALAEPSEDYFLRALTRVIFAELCAKQEDWAGGVQQVEHAERMFRAAGSAQGVAGSLRCLSWYQANLGHYPEATTLIEQARALYRQHGCINDEADTREILGIIAQRTGRHEQAIQHCTEALELYIEYGNLPQTAVMLERIGNSHAAAGRPEMARPYLARAARWYQEQGYLDQAASLRRRLAELGGEPES
ncbi:tetratricopeptide repeat protein [Crossiella sp. SN42]|uniref:helix-turn-helix domain-containing protein n=1 Tax=Crossiella sp. SN42 TaxID=2944808 RepID=UPI00207CBD8F|nr:helix-turn-helix domain-containing protein [Crossiella sp. SN42]MCO1575163.1 tetratricopeptide repeat protein [Crossiella sp. SN42]